MYVASELKLAKNPMGHVPNLILKAVLDVSCHNDGRCHLLSADLIFFPNPVTSDNKSNDFAFEFERD